MTIFLETPRLILKRYVPADFENTCRLQTDPDVMRYVGLGVRTREEIAGWMEKFDYCWDTYGFGMGSVFHKETGEYMGRAGFYHLGLDYSKEDYEIGVILFKQYWGQAYAYELSLALLEWGFKNMPISRIIATAHHENTQSRHVIEKKLQMRFLSEEALWGVTSVLYEIERKDFQNVA